MTSQNRCSAVFVGSDTLLLQCVTAWRQRGHEVVAIVTDAERVRNFADDEGIRCATPAEWTSIEDHSFDFLFAITWLHLLPDAVLRKPRRRAINFHDGPLPRYAGLNATCWALWHGESEHAVTWHVIEPEVDTGDILLQEPVQILPDDSALTLNARCFARGEESFTRLTELLAADTAQPKPQDLAHRTYFGAGARPPRLGVIDWREDAETIQRLVRAFDHGPYRNPVCVAKVWTGSEFLVPRRIGTQPRSGKAPGTIVGETASGVCVATATDDVVLGDLHSLSGAALDADEVRRVLGTALPTPTDTDWRDLDKMARGTGQQERAWLRALRTLDPLPVPGGSLHGHEAVPAKRAVPFPAVPAPAVDVSPTSDDARLPVAALCAAFLARKTGRTRFDLGFEDVEIRSESELSRALRITAPPVSFAFDAERPAADAIGHAIAQLADARARGPLLRDVALRYPRRDGAEWPLHPPVRLSLGSPTEVRPGELTLAVEDVDRVVLHFDNRTIGDAAATQLLAQLTRFANAVAAGEQHSLATTPILSDDERRELLALGTPSRTGLPTVPSLAQQFADQVVRTPDAIAITDGTAELTYRELDLEVQRVANALGAKGAASGTRIGLCMGRGNALVVTALAVLRTGAAYVPLDPTYPQDRLTHMTADADLTLIVTDGEHGKRVQDCDVEAIPFESLDRAAPSLATQPTPGEDPAYVIYTSGSTGRPKGVVVRNRNVANFFTGMDDVLGVTDVGATESRGTWLAVTSLSFDISVLELLWTLCRGFRVVVHEGEGRTAHGPGATEAPSTRPLTFSLFYFASNEEERAADKYQLLLDGSRFADEHGFEAVWTPERHFHAFGGLYPNPAVTSAAIAAVTERVHLRAGSCVSPLHSPIRVAEDWALVDNLSNGRVGISFAAGWQPNDFVIAPNHFADRKQRMFDDIRTVQALWRGQTVEFPRHDGERVAVRTLPRPVQRELPTWVTIAGNPETFRMAGESGAHVLTHLLGQSTDDLATKLEIYRKAWRDAGHTGAGQVTLMLHTFVGTDEAQVRQVVEQPLKDYLASSVDLIKQAAWSFPAFQQRTDGSREAVDGLMDGGVSESEMAALLDHAFERYYESSGLFGTPETCHATLDRLRRIGIDEVACLIDFGIPSATVMAGLPHLATLKTQSDAVSAVADTGAGARRSVAEQIEQENVTHLQCTPSMAAMLLLEPASEAAFGRLEALLVGGEALPGALAEKLVGCTQTVHNMYGPTETTVWSTTHRLDGTPPPVPIGRPMRNQPVYVLDEHRQLAPRGETGELWIGGEGVVAGYHGQPELTDERFVPDPFAATPKARMYRTGDLVRWREDGLLEYLGRADQQVKVRGYRIELGEIESVLAQMDNVGEVAVTAETDLSDPSNVRLVAFFVAKGSAPTEQRLREHVQSQLPHFMVPQQFAQLSDMPRTPNHKLDRKALSGAATRSRRAAGSGRPKVNAADATEAAILEVWQSALQTEEVGVEDNFFDSGGHSILAVQVQRTLRQDLSLDVQVTDLFRFPTVRSLAHHVTDAASGKTEPTAAQKAAERAKARRQLRRR